MGAWRSWGTLPRLVMELGLARRWSYAACCAVNILVCVHSVPTLLCISYHKGTLKTKADMLSGVNFISVALKHKQK